MPAWLHIHRAQSPLIVSVPHAGLDIPDDLAAAFVSLDRARADADFHVDRLYAFARDLGATFICTSISRSVIDVNRDPSGVSLYPGMATTELCPTARFNDEPLYRDGRAPEASEIARRRTLYFDPYHAAIAAEIARLGTLHRRIVLYDAHSIVSRAPRLFEGELPQFNIGTFGGRSCAQSLTQRVAAACTDESCVINGRFKGGWITRRYGAPQTGVHAIQMELAMRGYLDEGGPWPPVWDEMRARPMQAVLRRVLGECLAFAEAPHASAD
jgi:formiminoglutamase